MAELYARTRASMERQGMTMAPLNVLIDSHAESIGTVLVTNDQAVRLVGNLRVEDWTEADLWMLVYA